jgi:hypothetical protein
VNNQWGLDASCYHTQKWEERKRLAQIDEEAAHLGGVTVPANRQSPALDGRKNGRLTKKSRQQTKETKSERRCPMQKESNKNRRGQQIVVRRRRRHWITASTSSGLTYTSSVSVSLCSSASPMTATS